MSDDEQKVLEQRRREAYEALEVAIEKMTTLLNSQADDGQNWMAVDAVLLIGSQRIDEDGDRCGAVDIAPRHGWQPGYITAGLLAMATERVVG